MQFFVCLFVLLALLFPVSISNQLVTQNIAVGWNKKIFSNLPPSEKEKQRHLAGTVPHQKCDWHHHHDRTSKSEFIVSRIITRWVLLKNGIYNTNAFWKTQLQLSPNRNSHV